MVFDQTTLLQHLRQYVKYKNLHVQINAGYCHGLTLLWLYHMAIKKENDFYKIILKIIFCDTKEHYQLFDKEIERFLCNIEWLQNSHHYIYNTNQLDVDKLLDLPKELSLSYSFTPLEIEQTLSKILQNEKMLCVSGTHHTIGIFQRDSYYYLYDANYTDGQANRFHSIKALTSELISVLYPNTLFTDGRFPLQLNMLSIEASNQQKVKRAIYHKLINDNKLLQKKSENEVTNLYLACESGDEFEVDCLLRKKVDINHVSNKYATALKIACEKGYTNIVEKLLKEKANVDLCGKSKLTPLYFAIQHHHAEVAKILLKHGANPLIGIREKNPMMLAIQKKQWDVILQMCYFLPSLKLLSLSIRENLIEHLPALQRTFRQEKLTKAQKNKIEMCLEEIRAYKAGYLKFFNGQLNSPQYENYHIFKDLKLNSYNKNKI